MFSEEAFAPVLEPEAQAIRALYAQGIVRSVWSRDDVPGACLLIEAESLDRAREIVAGFPLVERGMAEVQVLIPLRGYRGFGPRS